MNYFAGTAEYPYHISVAAVVMNSEGKIAAHHFKEFKGIPDCYILMRETIEPNESLEQALDRGLMEEFGVTARLLHHIGSRNSVFTDGATGASINKTTLYFLMEMATYNEDSRLAGDREADSSVEWHEPSFLIKQIRAKAEQMGEGAITEADIIERLSRGTTNEHV
jgi:ADP-ribose pyrophosphatase YjhB (NUDIX family)